MKSKLNNPVWNSLNEIHKDLSIEIGDFKFYHPDFCPFGAYDNQKINGESLLEYAELTKNFFLVGNSLKQLPQNLLLKNELICNQMVLETPIQFELTKEIIKLNNDYEKELSELVNLVQPGYFMKKTSQMGDYFGVFENEKLVAVTGERMRMNNMTEVSAVVTHTDFTGLGLAKQLVSFVSNKIIQENKIPFLHVAETNSGAINLYEKLGYHLNQKISFCNYSKI